MTETKEGRAINEISLYEQLLDALWRVILLLHV